LDWSPTQNDLFLSAFSGTEDFSQQSGLIQLWTLSNRKSPDYVINYQTELTSAMFYKDNPNLVIGGSVTGQIMFWDISTKRPVPEQKSPLGIGTDNNSHCYPIHCLAIVGKDNNLISISTDGVMCEWSLSNLSTPINRYVISPNDVNDQDKDSLNEIGPLCVGANNSNNCIIIGCDENDIYNIKLEEKRYNVIDSYKGNKGPVFCVDIHPTSPDWGNSFSDLFLSCGADWTTKLWTTSQSEEPLITFNQSQDYIYSAKWHPTNPSIFATGDGSGNIDIYDLNKDREIPTYRYDLKTAINRLGWSCDGKKLAAGDINGHIAVFSSEKDVVNVKTEDTTKFQETVQAIKEKCKLEAERKKKKEMK
jgi:dynein intermediate chain